jgi:hypothetical protein
VKQITLKIAAGNAEEIGVVGDYVRIKTAQVPVRIEADKGQVDATIEEGDALNLQQFTRLRVSHSDAAEQTVTLLIGNGTSADSSKVGGSMAVASMPDVAVPFTQTAPVMGLASAAIVAANASRRFLWLQNNHASAEIRLGMAGGAAVAGAGPRLSPGASVLLDVATCSNAVYGISDTAGVALDVVEG